MMNNNRAMNKTTDTMAARDTQHSAMVNVVENGSALKDHAGMGLTTNIKVAVSNRLKSTFNMASEAIITPQGMPTIQSSLQQQVN